MKKNADKKDKKTAIRLTWEIWTVAILGVIIFALPISVNHKYLLAIPLYGLFLFFYYRAKKRSSQD